MIVRSAGRRRGLVSAILIIGALSSLAARCLAEEMKDIAAGHDVASRMCSQCHLIGPLPGPPFMDIAKSEYGAPASLESFLRSTHSDISHPGGMPRMQLSADQIRAIAAYIKSLRETP